MVNSNFRHMILFIDKYYSSAANYIATGIEKNLTWIWSLENQNFTSRMSFSSSGCTLFVNATESDKRLNQMQTSGLRKYIS